MNKSLVQASEDPDGALRFTLLRTVREFALEELRDAGSKLDDL